MKKFLALIALALVGTANAADLSSVGTSGTEAVVDYSYSRALNSKQYLAGHEAQAGLQLNAGSLGSLFVEAGDTQRVTNYRLNTPKFTIGYANGVKLGQLSLVADFNYSALTGDRWVFGNNDARLTNVAAGDVEANFPVNFVVSHYLVTIKPFVDYTRSYVWANGDHGSLTTNGVAVGSYANLTDSLVVKAGYTRDWTWFDHSQGLVANLSYKF